MNSKDKIEKFMKNSQNCAICGAEVLFNASSIRFVSITESGQINEPFNIKEGMMSVMLPLCAYHMVFAQFGIIATTTSNQIIFARKLPEFEKMTDIQLKVISKVKRNNQSLHEQSQIAKAILEARKFQTEMDEETKRVNKIRDNSSCEKHRGEWVKDCEVCFKNFQESLSKDWEEKNKNARQN